MRKRGSLFVEVLISILVFLIGVLILMSAMTMSLKIISESENTIITDQDLINKVDSYMLSRLFSHTETPLVSLAPKLLDSQINIGGFNLNYSVYRYKRSGKAAGYFDVLQRR